MSPSRRCYFCGISTIHYGPRRRSRAPVRSYQLNDDFLLEHPSVMEYAGHMIEEPQITAEKKICRPCLQRADRFVIRQRRERMQEERNEAAQQAATDVVVEPSSSSSSRGIINDPLDVIGVPEEVIVPEVQDAHTQTSTPVFPVHDFKRVPYNSIFCIASGCNNQNDLHRIPLAFRIDCLYKQNIYISFGNRACSEHLMSTIWNNLEENSRSTKETFNSRQMSAMLKLLQKKDTQYLNFERLESLDDYVLHFYAGYTKDNFLNILEQTPSITQTFKKPKTALATVLCKLHTGDSNERLSSIFRMTSQQFGTIMKKVRHCLCSEFVPKNLGFDHIYGPNRASSYRNELLERILRISNVLFSNSRNPVITICDGTYFYIQKSSNYAFQRESYSIHKYRNLLKVFLIVSPDGYIIETFGPYEAKKSDASIMEELISERDDNPFHWFFEAGDIFILDRGFRDVIKNLEEAGYEAYMPLTKDDDERQLTTRQANESRKVTLCRWVVESVNGRIKNQFRQLRSQYVNIAAPHLHEEVRIACALINAYGVRLTDNALVNEIINEIYLKYDAPNLLSELVIHENLNMRLSRL
ncbi:uncharacterized protein LOC128674998 [Plodia interpunctella]|uniref:uncharacterized protein LOC128674998 n=1 Tax=Plodia interpunctella TaxID=58824 RepID=UPI0023688D4B|nr:uncharacterized protein LOC128674998 [Plodia interpunctella]